MGWQAGLTCMCGRGLCKSPMLCWNWPAGSIAYLLTVTVQPFTVHRTLCCVQKKSVAKRVDGDVSSGFKLQVQLVPLR